MKKMIIAFLAVTLVFSLIGCDAMLNVMGKMSNNVAGTEKKVIDDSLNAAKPVSGGINKSEPEIDGSKTTITKSFGVTKEEGSKPLFSIKETTDSSEETKVTSVTLTKDLTLEFRSDAASMLEDIEAIITPTDISEVIRGLQSGSSSEIEAELNKPADKESKTAAEGTQAFFNAFLVNMKHSEEEIDKETNEENKTSMTEYNKMVDNIIGIINVGTEEKPMTQGDVVVFTALTNAIFNNVEDLVSLAKKSNYGEHYTEEEREEANKQLSQIAATELITLSEVISVVPSDISKGVLNLIDTAFSSSKV